MSVLLVERPAEGVVLLRLNRPDALNALNLEVRKAIAAALREARDDASVRAVVVTGNDKAFAAGADLKELRGLTGVGLMDLGIHRIWDEIAAFPKPMIAAVNGFALGGGCELALACDLIIAGPRAVFALPEVAVGVIPGGGGTQLLVQRIGWSRAADLIFTARRIDAAEAYRLGLADRVVDAPREEALALAAAIAANSPVGVRNAKKAMRTGLALALDDGLDVENECWADTAFSPDRAEGVRAFAEKRRPNWPGWAARGRQA